MAYQLNFTTLTQRAGAAALFAAGLTLSGCAIDPVFAHRFNHCMDFWQAQERNPQMTVYPEGQDKVGYCMDWSNDGIGVGVLAEAVRAHQSDVERES